ncbi:MAG: SDR family NAD(P)-dependent oxidoreductase [Proteobacteria bacterium]|nr:SDR family NAD(P)-dependent oxidoreductase [Pseudomonadota bacterium]MDA1351109.1 SDR family NAD(P)-dependent oxidoreductase [Pseudomonadota bacterium]
MKSFSNKVAVITGAGSGMGRYLAILMAKAGANVAICEINETTLAETHTMMAGYGVNVSVHVLDVADKAAIEALPAQVIEQHGQVDLVFNNAGVTVDSTFEDMSETDWDWVMNINLQGVINSTRAFLPHLQQRPEAALINTSSIFGMITVPNQSVYHTAKFAVRGFTECLAKELKDSNVQIHCVHPGHIGTNIVTNARMNKREDAFSPMQQMMGKLIGIGSTQEEMADFFRNNGMHPSRASNIILKGVLKNRMRIFVGADAKLMDLSQRLFPMHYDRVFPLFQIPLTLMRNKKPLNY